MTALFVRVPCCGDYQLQDERVSEGVSEGVAQRLGEGGSGVVVRARRRSDAAPVALKLFGYTSSTPSLEDIHREINTLYQLRGAQGCLQIEGTFLDTAAGMLPHKVVPEPFPVIVMELLTGGALFDMIEAQSSMSEFELSFIFKHIVTALSSLHSRGFIHRDLKLENLMLMSRSGGALKQDIVGDLEGVKIIDFGLMTAAVPAASHGLSKRSAPRSLCGTPGYYAPESLLYKEYSTASDIWQLGCVLYSLLSGCSPFHPDHPDQTIFYPFFEMSGENWTGISDSAKDLVRKLLQKIPAKRSQLSEVLAHPWLQYSAAVDAPCRTPLGHGYIARIHRLKIRQQLKRVFLDEKIVKSHKLRQDSFNGLRNACRSTDRSSGTSEKCHVDCEHENNVGMAERHTDIDEVEERKWQGMKKMVLSARTRLFENNSSCLDYDSFRAVLMECELSQWATPECFRLFDIDGTGMVNLKEFLLSLLALQPNRPRASSLGRRSDESNGRKEDKGEISHVDVEDSAWLFFSLFDLNSTGYIDIHELRLVVDCFINADQFTTNWNKHACSSYSHSDESTDWATSLLSAIDTSKSGTIDFHEFKMFYETVLTQSHMGS